MRATPADSSRPAGGAGRGGRVGSALLTALLLSGCPAATAAEPPWFADRSEASGLIFHHVNGMSGHRYMAEMMGAGVALLDYDGDGDLDVYLVQGRPLGIAGPADLFTTPRHDPPWTDRLFRNDGPGDGLSMRFTDVTEQAGLAPGAGYGMGVAAGDYDGDGHVDLYVTALGPNRLLRNLRDGRFEDVTAAAGVDDPRWSVPAAFLDYDADGDLDLYVGNYVDHSPDNHRECRASTGIDTYCSPLMYRPESDRLFRNEGDGTFRDVSRSSGIAAPLAGALGVIPADLDDDGDLDLYVANDGLPNLLWLNQGDGVFVEDAVFAGVAVDRNGMPEASMGVDAGDPDGDGDLDLFMTHLRGQTNTLYLNDGFGVFEDRTIAMGLAEVSFRMTGFGTAWLDVDNDGLLDLVVVNGEVVVPPERAGEGALPLDQPDQLFRGTADGWLVDASALAGPALTRSGVSRGLAIGDLDGDGDDDLIVTVNDGRVRLLENLVGQDAHWLGLEVVDAAGSSALGARVELLDTDGATVASAVVRRAGSYASARDPRLRFGLGESEASRSVRVCWPSAGCRVFERLRADRYHQLAPR